MRKGEKDLVSAAADAELGAAAVHCAGDVRSPVHAALQHRAADDEVTNNNSAIKPTCHFEDNIDIYLNVLHHNLIIPWFCCRVGVRSVCSVTSLRRWCGSQTSESRHLSRGRKKLARGESRGDTRAENTEQTVWAGSVTPGTGLTADCRHWRCRHYGYHDTMQTV